MVNHAVQCMKESLHRGSFKSKVPILSKLQTVTTNPVSWTDFFFFLQGANTLHIEPKALQSIDESACE